MPWIPWTTCLCRRICHVYTFWSTLKNHSTLGMFQVGILTNHHEIPLNHHKTPLNHHEIPVKSTMTSEITMKSPAFEAVSIRYHCRLPCSLPRLPCLHQLHIPRPRSLHTSWALQPKESPAPPAKELPVPQNTMEMSWNRLLMMAWSCVRQSVGSSWPWISMDQSREDFESANVPCLMAFNRWSSRQSKRWATPLKLRDSSARAKISSEKTDGQTGPEMCVLQEAFHIFQYRTESYLCLIFLRPYFHSHYSPQRFSFQPCLPGRDASHGHVVRNLSTEHDSLLSLKVSRFKNSTALFCFHESLPAS